MRDLRFPGMKSQELRYRCLALAILALASGAVGASAAAVPTVRTFSPTGIFFIFLSLAAGVYLVAGPRFWAKPTSQTSIPTPEQWQSLCASHERLQEELAAQRQETAQLIEDKTLLQFLKAEQDLERQRVAQDLHDHLLQHLTALLMQWETKAEKPSIEGKTLLPGVAVLREMFRHGRRIMNRLSTAHVADEGVVASLQRLTDAPAGSPLVATFQADVQFDRLTPLAECALVRIARETLDHLRTQRAAREATVQLRQLDSHLRLDIQAYACGKPPSPEPSDLLRQLTETAELIDARVSLGSLPDSVQLQLDMPLFPHTLPLEKTPTSATVVPERPGRRL